MKQLYYRYLAFLYAFTFRTDRRRFVGFAISGWIKLLSLGLLVTVWIQRWAPELLWMALLVVVGVYLSYWLSRRASYVKFVAAATATPTPTDLVSLPVNQRVQMWATGIFLLRDEGEQLLLKPAEYWQVPLGNHIVMVKQSPERFAYQFFDGAGLLEVKPGCLLFGSILRHTLAVTILETHLAIEPAQFNFANAEKLDETSSKKRRLYFTFADAESQYAVWHNIFSDARRIRS